MQCPICDSPNAKMEQRKSSFLGSLFGAKPSSPRMTCSCTNCRQTWGADRRDGSIWEDSKAALAKAREEWLRRGYVGPDMVCKGYPGGAGAEVTGFNEDAKTWLKANVKSDQCMQVPMSEVSQIVANATKDGLQVRTNNIGCAQHQQPKTKLVYFGFDNHTETTEDVLNMVQTWGGSPPCPQWRATVKRKEADFQVLFGVADVTIIDRRGQVVYKGGTGVLYAPNGNPDGSGVNICKLTSD